MPLKGKLAHFNSHSYFYMTHIAK